MRMRCACLHAECMTALQIRNLPDDVHRTLKARAAKSGMSLSEYAAGLLRKEAEKPTLDELWERVKERGQAGTASAERVVELIRADRESR